MLTQISFQHHSIIIKYHALLINILIKSLISLETAVKEKDTLQGLRLNVRKDEEINYEKNINGDKIQPFDAAYAGTIIKYLIENK